MKRANVSGTSIDCHHHLRRSQNLTAAPAVTVAESFNVTTGLDSKFGTELLKRGVKGGYNNIGTHKEGSRGLWR